MGVVAAFNFFYPMVLLIGRVGLHCCDKWWPIRAADGKNVRLSVQTAADRRLGRWQDVHSVSFLRRCLQLDVHINDRYVAGTCRFVKFDNADVDGMAQIS